MGLFMGVVYSLAGCNGSVGIVLLTVCCVLEHRSDSIQGTDYIASQI